MTDAALVKHEEDEEEEDEDQHERNDQHNGKIVTEEANENGKDDCSDLTDHNHHDDSEEVAPKSFPQKVSRLW